MLSYSILLRIGNLIVLKVRKQDFSTHHCLKFSPDKERHILFWVSKVHILSHFFPVNKVGEKYIFILYDSDDFVLLSESIIYKIIN